MRRRQFLSALSMGSLIGCANMPSQVSANEFLTDDGTMELRPEFTVQHVQGQANSNVLAAFFNSQKKLVRLRSSDTVAVNGHVLEERSHSGGYYYQAAIPVTEGAFTFLLTRAGAGSRRYPLELPVLGITEVPKFYRPLQVLRVPVKYVEPPEHVALDSYHLHIDVPERRYSLDSITKSKDNPYELGRRPDIRDGAILFNLIGNVTPQIGVHPARLFRQHRVDLRKLMRDGPSGSATLSNTLPFKIEVR